MKKQLLRKQEVADSLSVSVKIVNELIQAKKLQTIEVRPGVVRIKRKSVTKYIHEAEKTLTLGRVFEFLWLAAILAFGLQILVMAKSSYPNNTAPEWTIWILLTNIGLGIVFFIGVFLSRWKEISVNKFFPKISYLWTFAAIYLLSAVIPVLAAGDITQKKTVPRESNFVQTITPSVTPTVPAQKKTVIDPDPIIDCESSYPNCKGSSIRVRKSQCSLITCCQVGSTWSIYQTTEKCKEAQKSIQPQAQITVTQQSPSSTKVPVYLTWYKYTTYCPSQNVSAVQAIDADIAKIAPKAAQDANTCEANFKKNDSCWIACNAQSSIDWNPCFSMTYNSPEYKTCMDAGSAKYSTCISSCPNPSDSCKWAWAEVNRLSSQINDLCK